MRLQRPFVDQNLPQLMIAHVSFGSICSTGAQDLDHLGVTSSDGEG
jgi:hypothetical protein